MSNQMLGTVNYMAPEQINDAKNVGPETDVYGLGATLYHCLTGIAPISGGDFTTVLQRLRETLPVAPRKVCPDVDADLELICLRCIQKNPKERYESAEHLAADLHRYLSGEPVERAPASLTCPPRTSPRQNLEFGFNKGGTQWDENVIPPSRSYRNFGLSNGVGGTNWQSFLNKLICDRRHANLPYLSNLATARRSHTTRHFLVLLLSWEL